MMTRIVLISLLCCLCYRVSFATWYTVFQCSEEWPLETDDNDKMMARFQNMLTYYQHQCPPGHKRFMYTFEQKGGIGYTTIFGAENILRSFELGNIFRPQGTWIWAEPGHCFTKTESVDCYSMPDSYCLLEDTMPSWLTYNATDAVALIPEACDVCTMANRTKKSILWVFGQILHYQIRLPPALEQKVLSRVKHVFNTHELSKYSYHLKGHHDHASTTLRGHGNSGFHVDPKTGLKCLTAAIHVRSGHPDQGRIPMDGTEHLQVLRDHNVRLKTEKNATICQVYVGGDHVEDTIFYPKTFSKDVVGNFSRAFETRIDSFIFKSLPRYNAAPGEIEYQIKFIREAGNVTLELLYQEFMEDLRLYTHADVFVGSHSNLFTLVSGLRQAYYPTLSANATCFLDSHIAPPSLNCMHSQGVLNFYRFAYGGFEGGSLFFP